MSNSSLLLPDCHLVSIVKVKKKITPIEVDPRKITLIKALFKEITPIKSTNKSTIN